MDVSWCFLPFFPVFSCVCSFYSRIVSFLFIICAPPSLIYVYFFFKIPIDLICFCYTVCVCVRERDCRYLLAPVERHTTTPPRTRVANGCEPPTSVWMLGTKLGPPRERFVLWTSEQSLPPLPRISPFGLWVLFRSSGRDFCFVFLLFSLGFELLW